MENSTISFIITIVLAILSPFIVEYLNKTILKNNNIGSITGYLIIFFCGMSFSIYLREENKKELNSNIIKKERITSNKNNSADSEKTIKVDNRYNYFFLLKETIQSEFKRDDIYYTVKYMYSPNNNMKEYYEYTLTLGKSSCQNKKIKALVNGLNFNLNQIFDLNLSDNEIYSLSAKKLCQVI